MGPLRREASLNRFGVPQANALLMQHAGWMEASMDRQALISLSSRARGGLHRRRDVAQSSREAVGLLNTLKVTIIPDYLSDAVEKIATRDSVGE